ncbi:MAG: serine--tRNA ligase [Candidatus Bathyarchaeota archaeon]|nr:serine--tRNA ligase [Candidatus Bathyarchaeota archaeon]
MLDIKLIRDNPELVRRNMEKRGNPEILRTLDLLLEYDRVWRQKLTNLNNLRKERNRVTAEIAKLKKRGESVDAPLLEAQNIDEEITRLEREVSEYEEKVRNCLMILPNLLHESVPMGKSELDNVTVRTWGEIRKFNFRVRDHIELGISLGIMDLERAGKVAGARFFYLKSVGVLLDMALINFAVDILAKKGYIPIEPPLLMRRKPYEGVIALSDFEEMLYKVEGEDLYLIATSEHPIAAMFMDEVLGESDLPLKFVGVSTNFRKEAGVHGRDTRGIFRTHQFNKVEQFIFCKPEESWSLHEELLSNAEEIFQKLGLPYRVVNICSSEIGTVAAKKYDIEVWMPAQCAYREVVSCSNCTDFQARRLNIKYREMEGKPPKGYVHTLNSTAVATGRTIVAILENYQQEDGSVVIPEVLRKYMGGIEKIEPKGKA